MDHEKDILQVLDNNTLEKYMLKLKDNLPDAIVAHHYIYNYLKWVRQWETNPKLKIKLANRCSCIFYGHRNKNVENCTFVTLSGNEDFWIFVFTLEKSGQELVDCLEESRRILWSKRPIYVCIASEHIDVVKMVLEKKNSTWEFCVPEDVCVVPKEKVLQYEARIPENVSIRELNVDDVKLINDYWVHQYNGSYDYIKTCLIMNGGLGVYEKQTNKLIAWALINEFYCCGFLHCIDEERRKGYGCLILKALTKQIAERDDVDIYTVFLEDNNASKTLLTSKLEFENVKKMYWIEITQS